MAADDLIAAHLDHLRHRDRAATTIYARRRALARLEAWLATRYGVACSTRPRSGPDGSAALQATGETGTRSGPGLLAGATAADLLA